MPFKIVKASRIFSGTGYTGPTCTKADTESNQTYEDIEVAKQDARKMSKINPVGFNVVDTSNSVVVYRCGTL